jgi:predicted phage terminase large subunit-like protein
MASMSNRRKLELLKERAVRNARVSFLEYRRVMNPKAKWGWWQREVAQQLQQFFDDLIAGKRPKLVIQAPPQHGKLIFDNIDVITSTGWKKHGDIVVGDQVRHPSGRWVGVVALSTKAAADWRVTLDNGEVVWCHGAHEWTVHNRNTKRTETLETQQMAKRGARSSPDRHPLYTGVVGKRGCHYTYRLPLVAPFDGHDLALPLDPYVLGAWLGDGSQTAPVLTYDCDDEAVVDRIQSRGYPLMSTWCHKDTGVLASSFEHLRERLRAAGVFAESTGVRAKRIPDIYLAASLRQRLDLLAGLIDTDGYCYQKNGRCVFTTADAELAETFCHLMSTFGWGYSNVIEWPRTSSSGIVGKKPYFVIGFNPTLAIPCALERKRNRVLAPQRRVAIVAIDHMPSGKVGRCIQVDAPDGLYLVGRTMQPTHNSVQIIDFISWIAGRLPDNRTIYTSFSDRLGIRANLRMQRQYGTSVYREIFPGTTIGAPGYLKNATVLEYAGRDGYFRNTTVRGSITGESLDLGVVDDPIRGRADANSDAVREATWDWFTDDFMSRFSEDAGLLIILTRWHVDDPVGRLVERYPAVKVLSYPAIAEVDEPHRKKGEALFPEHKSIDFLLERKAIMDENNFGALYQQNPTRATGNLIHADKIVVVDAIPAGLSIRWCRGWDFAASDGKKSDYTAGPRLGALSDGRYIIDDVYRSQELTADRDRAVINCAKRDGPATQIGIPQDPGAAGKSQVYYLTTQLAGFSVVASPEQGDKSTRAEPFAAQVNVGNVMMLRAPWNKALLDELRPFPYGVNDDQGDGLSRAFNSLMQNNLGLVEFMRQQADARKNGEAK